MKQSQILTAEAEKQGPILRAEGERHSQILRAEDLQVLPQIAQGAPNKIWIIRRNSCRR